MLTATKIQIPPWQMLDLTPPELEGYIAMTQKLMKEPHV